MRDDGERTGVPGETSIAGSVVRAPLAELPLSSVLAESRWNCRAPYSEDDIAEAVQRYRNEPMLHPPSVARDRPNRYLLVTGFLRFEVMRRLGAGHDDAAGWFRIVEGSEVDRLLWNLGENTARRDLTGYELVERVWMLHARGVPKDRLTKACGFKVSYLNRLLRIRRRAHPELYERFRADPTLTVARMGRLVVHEASAQMTELHRSDTWQRRAVEVEQGYSEEPEPEGEGALRKMPQKTQRRRRLPPRAHVRRLLAIQERRHPQDEYGRGVIASLRHLLYGEPLTRLEALERPPVEERS